MFRVLSIVLLFTPSLGLFDTLHHGRLATFHVNYGQRIFDYSSDGLPIKFVDAWEPFILDDISDFLHMPVTAVIVIMIVMAVLHIFVSTFILKITLKKNFSAELFVHRFHSLISPPLHVDWESIYRENEHTVPVLTCWKRYIFSSYYLLFRMIPL